MRLPCKLQTHACYEGFLEGYYALATSPVQYSAGSVERIWMQNAFPVWLGPVLVELLPHVQLVEHLYFNKSELVVLTYVEECPSSYWHPKKILVVDLTASQITFEKDCEVWGRNPQARRTVDCRQVDERQAIVQAFKSSVQNCPCGLCIRRDAKEPVVLVKANF